MHGAILLAIILIISLPRARGGNPTKGRVPGKFRFIKGNRVHQKKKEEKERKEWEEIQKRWAQRTRAPGQHAGTWATLRVAKAAEQAQTRTARVFADLAAGRKSAQDEKMHDGLVVDKAQDAATRLAEQEAAKLEAAKQATELAQAAADAAYEGKLAAWEEKQAKSTGDAVAAPLNKLDYENVQGLEEAFEDPVAFQQEGQDIQDIRRIFLGPASEEQWQPNHSPDFVDEPIRTFQAEVNTKKHQSIKVPKKIKEPRDREIGLELKDLVFGKRKKEYIQSFKGRNHYKDSSGSSDSEPEDLVDMFRRKEENKKQEEHEEEDFTNEDEEEDVTDFDRLSAEPSYDAMSIALAGFFGIFVGITITFCILHRAYFMQTFVVTVT